MEQKDIPTLVAIHVEDTAARYASFSSANMLYHYTSIDNIPKIIRGKKVCLRMTREDCFEDKQEGKLITEFYQIALERLYAAGKIDIAQYAYLKNVKMPTDDRALYKDEDGQMIHGKTSGVDYYVSCFSLNREDPYMYNAYISRPDKKGCCIGFHPKCWETEERLAGWYNDGCRLEALRVLYGEDAIHCIEDLLIRLLGLEELSMQDIETRIASIISDKLKRMRLCIKADKYKKENEARLVLRVPQSIPVALQHYVYNEGQRHYAEIELPSASIWHLYPSASVTDEDKSKLNEVLKDANVRERL